MSIAIFTAGNLHTPAISPYARPKAHPTLRYQGKKARVRDRNLTLQALASLFKFSLLVSIHVLEYLLGELVKTPKLLIFVDHFPNSHDLYVL